MKRGRSRAGRLCLLYDPRARRRAVTYPVGRYDRPYRTVFVKERRGEIVISLYFPSQYPYGLSTEVFSFSKILCFRLLTPFCESPMLAA